MTVQDMFITEKFKLDPGAKNYNRLLRSLKHIEAAGNPYYAEELEAWQKGSWDKQDMEFWEHAAELMDEINHDDCDNDYCAFHGGGEA